MSQASNIYNRSKGLKAYDDQNQSEHKLVSSMSDEFIQIESPRMYYFRMDFKKTKVNADETSQLYGETEKQELLPGVEVFSLVERSPIIQELTRLGLSNIKDLNFIANIDDITARIGAAPNSGDYILVYSVNTEGKAFKDFYQVASVLPINITNSRYNDYLINAEQTSLDTVDDAVRQMLVKEMD